MVIQSVIFAAAAARPQLSSYTLLFSRALISIFCAALQKRKEILAQANTNKSFNHPEIVLIEISNFRSCCCSAHIVCEAEGQIETKQKHNS